MLLRQKRLFSSLLFILALSVALVACGGGNNNNTADTGNNAQPPTGGGATTTEPSGTDEPDIYDLDVTDEAQQLITDVLANRTPTTITYASWNIAQPQEIPMIEEYMERFDFITVEVVHIEEDDHMGSLQALAMAQQLPDAFLVSVVPEMMATGFLQDILPYGQQFEEWANIPRIALEAATYRGRVFGLPFSSYFEGMVVNDALWDANNLPRLEVGFSLEQLLNDLRVITDIGAGIGGISPWIQYSRGWLPNYFNNAFGPHGWDGERLNVNHPAYAQSIEFIRTLRAEGLVTDSDWLTEEQWASYDAGWWYDVFARGNMPVMNEGSWWIGTWTHLYNEGMPVRFVGLPGGTVVYRPVYAGISVQSQNPAVAMHFLNWMAFGDAGIEHRLDLRDFGRGEVDDDGNPILYPLGTLPPTTNSTLLRRFFDGEIPGIEEGLARVHESVIEGETIVPGHVPGLFNGNTGLTVVSNGETIENASVHTVFNSIIEGNTAFADVAADLDAFANSQVQQMLSEINFMLDMMGLTE